MLHLELHWKMQHCSIFFLNVFCKRTISPPSALNPEHCAAGLPHGFSFDPCFYLIDPSLNILEMIGFTEKWDVDVWEHETCWIFSFYWVDSIVGLSIYSNKEEYYSSHRQVGADFLSSFFSSNTSQIIIKVSKALETFINATFTKSIMKSVTSLSQYV